MRVALVHDYLNQYGGAEKVLEALHDLYPRRPSTPRSMRPASMPGLFPRLDDLHLVHAAAAVRPPPPSAQAYLLYSTAFERFDLSRYDLVISSSSAWAKGVITGPHTLHICYCHAPDALRLALP